MLTEDLQNDIKTVSDKALETFGYNSVMSMIVGEIGELLSLYGKKEQNRDTNSMWVDETADCLLMLLQLTHIMGEEEVIKRLIYKVNRFKNKLRLEDKSMNLTINLMLSIDTNIDTLKLAKFDKPTEQWITEISNEEKYKAISEDKVGESYYITEFESLLTNSEYTADVVAIVIDSTSSENKE